MLQPTRQSASLRDAHTRQGLFENPNREVGDRPAYKNGGRDLANSPTGRSREIIGNRRRKLLNPHARMARISNCFTASGGSGSLTLAYIHSGSVPWRRSVAFRRYGLHPKQQQYPLLTKRVCGAKSSLLVLLVIRWVLVVVHIHSIIWVVEWLCLELKSQQFNGGVA
jgi:hypothetical protein